MILILLTIIGILFLALELEDRLRIPSPLGLILLSYIAHLLFGGAFNLGGDPAHFAKLVILLLPILLISDSLELKIKDLREHGLSLFYLAIVSVSLSVLLGIATARTLFHGYDLSIPSIIALFAMVLATDPVSVVSIFSKFELPHRLKILAEGESLLNDATALIVFVYIGLYAMDGGHLSTGYITSTSLIVIGGSALLGIGVGLIGLLIMKTTVNRISEMLLLVLAGYLAFELSEFFYYILNLFGGHSHFHLSGILACIFAVITVNHLLTREVAREEENIHEREEDIRKEAEEKEPSRGFIAETLDRLKATVGEHERHRRTKEDVQLLALVANTVLFIAMAEVINFDLLWKYRVEIITMFVATTIIRALMMAKFAFITNQTTKMTNVNFRWWGVLTFAGIKGGLSIVMLMMIPPTFPHLEMFQAIVVGVILLSTFIYSGVLVAIIAKNSEIFRREKEEEQGTH